jgi:hypothetical protein
MIIKDNARKWICFFTFHIICEHDYDQIHSILEVFCCLQHEIRQLYKEEDSISYKIGLPPPRETGILQYHLSAIAKSWDFFRLSPWAKLKYWQFPEVHSYREGKFNETQLLAIAESLNLFIHSLLFHRRKNALSWLLDFRQRMVNLLL